MYEYNQLLFYKMARTRFILIKFICYRPDLNKIVYEHEGTLFQKEPIDFSEADEIGIFNFFEKKINRLKKDIKRKEKLINSQKKEYKEFMKERQKVEVRIKESNSKIFGYLTMNALVNSDVCDEDIKEIKKQIHTLIEYKFTIRTKYFFYLQSSKDNVKRIKKLKKEIGEYKNERTELIRKGIYIHEDGTRDKIIS